MHSSEDEQARQAKERISVHQHEGHRVSGLHFRANDVSTQIMANEAGDDRHPNMLMLDASAEEAAATKILNDPSFFKFTVVRHPWSRIVSGYLQKYVLLCEKDRHRFKQQYAHNIDDSLREPMTLTELLLALVHEPHPKINPHFRPSAELCDVGRTPYDFIADVENPAHTAFLLEKIKSPYPMPQRNFVHYKVDPADMVVPCTRETVDLAARLYAMDLELFGYTMDDAYKSCKKYGLAHPPAPPRR
jgi:hypothetical protein